MEDRYPSGRLRSPIGVREGGAAYVRLHNSIAHTALKLLAQRGFSEMTVDDVADLAAVSKRTVYRHFPSKTELAVAAIHELGGMFEYRQSHSSAKARLRNYLSSSDERDAVFGPVLATAIVNRHTEPALLAALRESVLEPRRELLERFIHEGQLTGEIRPDVSPAVLASLSTGLHMDHLTGMNEWFGDARRSGRVFSQIWPLLSAH